MDAVTFLGIFDFHLIIQTLLIGYPLLLLLLGQRSLVINEIDMLERDHINGVGGGLRLF